MNALLLCLVGLAGASAYAAPSAYQHQLSWEEAYTARTHWSLTSGGSSKSGGASKYVNAPPPAGSGAAYPTTTAGVFFSGVFTDHVVLQRTTAAKVRIRKRGSTDGNRSREGLKGSQRIPPFTERSSIKGPFNAEPSPPRILLLTRPNYSIL